MKINIGLNPLKWGRADPLPALPPKPEHEIRPETQVAIKSALQTINSSPIPLTMQQENIMSDGTKKTLLQKIGGVAKDVFTFLTSSRGQSLIATGEGLAVAINPGIGSVITIANTWLTEIIKAETLAAAAGTQDGTGTQKSALVLSAVTPQVLDFAKANGLATPTADKLAAANKALVEFLNAFDVTA